MIGDSITPDTTATTATPDQKYINGLTSEEVSDFGADTGSTTFPKKRKIRCSSFYPISGALSRG